MYFSQLDQIILCQHDINVWYDSIARTSLALTGKKRKLSMRDLELISEQTTHKDMRDTYWETKKKNNPSVGQSNPSRDMRADDPYFNPPRGYCSCSPSACRCSY
jgi:hypothetical protein